MLSSDRGVAAEPERSGAGSLRARTVLVATRPRSARQREHRGGDVAAAQRMMKSMNFATLEYGGFSRSLPARRGCHSTGSALLIASKPARPW